MNVRLFALVAILTSGVTTTGCNPLAPPPPGKELADGCYYAGHIPVLKIEGDRGTFLIPGNVHTVAVERDASSEQTGATFTPGFHIVPGPPLRVARATDFPSISLMMKPYSEEPTIMGAFADPQPMADLVRGVSC